MTNEPTPEQVALLTGHTRADREWLLDDRDVWVKNPYYDGPPTPHPEDDDPDLAYHDACAVAHDARLEGRNELADEIMWPWTRHHGRIERCDGCPDDLPF